jgi:hypothetical protein
MVMITKISKNLLKRRDILKKVEDKMNFTITDFQTNVII